MNEDFIIENGVLKKYQGHDAHVIIPDGVTEIGSVAFYHCYSVKSLVLPESIRTICQQAFYDCGIRKIHIPDSVTSIENGAFLYCRQLKKICLPASLEILGNAFNECPQLSQISIAEENPYYTSADGVLYDKKLETLVRCPPAKSSLTILPTVTRIENYACYQCARLKELSLPENVTFIGKNAFYHCEELKELFIPEHVNFIGENALFCCERLASLTVSEQNLYYTARENILYDKEMRTLIWCSRQNRKAVIPETVTSIGSYAFSRCFLLTEINIPDSVTAIDMDAFGNAENITSCTYHGVRLLPEAQCGLFTGGLDHILIKTFRTIDEALGIRNFLPEKHCPWVKEKSCAITWSVFCSCPDNEKTYQYLQEHCFEECCFLIDRNYPEIMQEFMKKPDCLTKEAVLRLIMYANEKQNFEMQVMLMEYQYQHFSDADGKFSL